MYVRCEQSVLLSICPLFVVSMSTGELEIRCKWELESEPGRTCDSSSPYAVKGITHGRIIRAWKLGQAQASGTFIPVTCRRLRRAQVAGATVTRVIEVDARLHTKYCTDTFQTETHPPPSTHKTSPLFYITDKPLPPHKTSPSLIDTLHMLNTGT